MWSPQAMHRGRYFKMYLSRVAELVTWGCGRRPHEWTETTMRRVLVITASSIALAGCASFSLPSFELPSFQSKPAASTVEFESEPPGAEVKTSTGQTCRTPCALSVTANELSATFALTGYQPQTVPVRMTAAAEAVDPNTGQISPPRMVPNPVYVELLLAPPVRKPPPAAKPAPAKKPKTAAKPKPAAQPMAPAPAPAPAAPWPSPTPTPTPR